MHRINNIINFSVDSRCLLKVLETCGFVGVTFRIKSAVIAAVSVDWLSVTHTCIYRLKDSIIIINFHICFLPAFHWTFNLSILRSLVLLLG
jgi:Na+-translocating ferredoxin:NAD+ oxidoreductase RnfA subunit